MEALKTFVANNEVSAIGIGVIIFAIGIALAAKADTKWGYVIAAIGGAAVIYTLKVIRVF